MLTLIVAAAQVALTVFAAASLHAAFSEIGKRFEAQHPGTLVRFDFDGSQKLEAQLAQGAQADVFASADQRWMDRATGDGLVGTAAPFASNQLVIVASSNSNVNAAADLATPGLRLVVCAQAVPCGRYARLTLEKMEAEHVYGRGFASAVTHNVVSEEEDVELVLAKVSLGEADVGIVYRSDVAKPPQHVRVVELPLAAQPAIVYPIAQLKASASPALAADFVAFVRSSEGQEILRRFGFTSAPAATAAP